MISPALCALFDQWAAQGEVPADRRTRQFIARYLADMVAEQRPLAEPEPAPSGEPLPFDEVAS